MMVRRGLVTCAMVLWGGSALAEEPRTDRLERLRAYDLYGSVIVPEHHKEARLKYALNPMLAVGVGGAYSDRNIWHGEVSYVQMPSRGWIELEARLPWLGFAGPFASGRLVGGSVVSRWHMGFDEDFEWLEDANFALGLGATAGLRVIFHPGLTLSVQASGLVANAFGLGDVPASRRYPVYWEAAPEFSMGWAVPIGGPLPLPRLPRMPTGDAEARAAKLLYRVPMWASGQTEVAVVSFPSGGDWEQTDMQGVSSFALTRSSLQLGTVEGTTMSLSVVSGLVGVWTDGADAAHVPLGVFGGGIDFEQRIWERDARWISLASRGALIHIYTPYNGPQPTVWAGAPVALIEGAICAGRSTQQHDRISVCSGGASLVLGPLGVTTSVRYSGHLKGARYNQGG